MNIVVKKRLRPEYWLAFDKSIFLAIAIQWHLRAVFLPNQFSKGGKVCQQTQL